MRVVTVLCVAMLLGAAAGCGSQGSGPARTPLLTGKLEAGTFWKAPLTVAGNEGSDHPKGSRVEIYDQFLVVTTPEGLTFVHPHGTYSGLAIKKD
jgi:hypothetical protein